MTEPRITNDLAEAARSAVAIVRADQHADDIALGVLLGSFPNRLLPSLIAAFVQLVVAAQQVEPGDLDAFLDQRLEDIARAEAVALRVAEQQPTDEPDGEA